MPPRQGGDPGARARKDARLRELLAMGLPEPAARAVAAGQRDLNDVLRALAREAQATTLAERHAIPRSLALQVVDGQADLERILSKRRRQAYLLEHGEHSVFGAAVASGQPCVLGCLGRVTREVRILEALPYEVRVAPMDGGPEETLHKLTVKYACGPGEARAVRKAMGRDAALGAVVAHPLVRMQDRYALPDRLLFPWFEQAVRLRVTLVEGEQWTGTVASMSRYEFGLGLRAGATVTILRHALARVEPC